MDPWKKKEKSEVATKVSFVALSESFFDRLDIFSDARLLKITLVLLFFDENLLPTVSSGLAWPGAHTAAFQFCPNRSVSDAKKRSASQRQGKSHVATKLLSVALSESFWDRLDAISIARRLENTLVLLFFGATHYLLPLRASVRRGFSFCSNRSNCEAKSDPPASGSLPEGGGVWCRTNNTTSVLSSSNFCKYENKNDRH